MRNEPLKGKIAKNASWKPMATCYTEHNVAIVRVESVKSAVEYLKQQIADELAYRIMKEKITSGTINMIHQYIEEAFPDLYPSGRGIAEKRNSQNL
ncbi:MAG: hypothetical protein ACFFCM_07520 [Promethearchaeota archaeon]